MKRIFLPAMLLIFMSILQGCSKDFLRRYEKRIIGTWRITSINTFGIGGNSHTLPFPDGTFAFNNDGSLLYRNLSGEEFTGTWTIDKIFDDNDGTRRSLHVTAVNHSTQEILSEYYQEMIFLGTNHFKSTIESRLTTYVTHFRR